MLNPEIEPQLNLAAFYSLFSSLCLCALCVEKTHAICAVSSFFYAQNRRAWNRVILQRIQRAIGISQ